MGEIMIYLNNEHIRELGIDWPTLMSRIESTLQLMHSPEVVQPLKPYLRFRVPNNRIIAMPAFVGGDTDISGIKWIASFPSNVAHGLPRAHSTLILNNTENGAPVAILNSGLLSELRTAAVSAVMLRKYMELERKPSYRLGMIGWGPIGRRHMEMILSLYGDRIENIRIYDRKGIDPSTLKSEGRSTLTVASSWQEVYRESDLFVTCTSSTERYIDESPLPSSLLLNISLREYLPVSIRDIKAVIVDDWFEVCRENTDIEQLHLQHGLAEKDTLSLKQVVFGEELRSFAPSEPIFFNPMGMAAFDMTIAAYYWRRAEQLGVGVQLADSFIR
jgi:2,3-diaminopropionate biosynthesis protein SbnB